MGKNVLQSSFMNSQTNAAAQALDQTGSGLSPAIEQVRRAMLSRRFNPHPLLKNRHVMTMAGHFVPRNFPALEAS